MHNLTMITQSKLKFSTINTFQHTTVKLFVKSMLKPMLTNPSHPSMLTKPLFFSRYPHRFQHFQHPKNNQQNPVHRVINRLLKNYITIAQSVHSKLITRLTHIDNSPTSKGQKKISTKLTAKINKQKKKKNKEDNFKEGRGWRGLD